MNKYIPYILIMALVTYGIRALPITIFQKKIENKTIQSFLYYVPYAVLAAMSFPAIFSVSSNIIVSVGATLVALWMAYRNFSLLSVAIGASVALYIMELIL